MFSTCLGDYLEETTIKQGVKAFMRQAAKDGTNLPHDFLLIIISKHLKTKLLKISKASIP